MDPSKHAANQYLGTTNNLTTRIAIYNYSTNPQSWHSWVSERLPLAGDTLEVGAGTGELWRHVDTSSTRLTLTDFSPAMCSRLREVPNAKVEQCDAAALPFPDASFDSVIAAHMLYHVDDPDAALKEFARVLRPGGRLTISLDGQNDQNEFKALAESIGRPSVVSNTTRITYETTPEHLARYFIDATEEVYPINLEIPTPEPVLAYLGSMGESLTAEQEKVARDIVERKIKEDGCFRVQGGAILFTANRP
jgi:SAM-dependent methyltransferase